VLSFTNHMVNKCTSLYGNVKHFIKQICILFYVRTITQYYVSVIVTAISCSVLWQILLLSKLYGMGTTYVIVLKKD